MNEEQIRANIRSRPREITTADVRKYGDISQLHVYLYDGTDPNDWMDPISYLLTLGNNFGYTRHDDLVSTDSDNLLNVLIIQILNNDEVTKGELLKILKQNVEETLKNKIGGYPWQVIVRLQQEFSFFDILFLSKMAASAIINNYVDFLKYLIESFDVHPDTFAMMHRSSFEQLHNKNEEEDRLIHLAIKKKRYEIVKYLATRANLDYLAGTSESDVSFTRKSVFDLAARDPRMMAALLSDSVLLPNAKAARQATVSARRNVKKVVDKQATQRRAHLLGLRNGGRRKTRRRR